MKKNIRMGIFGCNRGMSFAKIIMMNNAEVVAVCDKDEYWLNKAKEKLGDGVAYYSDFEEFINHDMDAVLVANYFNEHAPYAIRLLEKGIHVLSECTPAGTMAECVQLVEAAEKSNATYMICENYPFMTFNREITRVCRTGTLGKFLFAEGEYNHPNEGKDAKFAQRYIPYLEHWRNFTPATYYSTHALAPLMYATGATPKRVTAFPIYAPLTERVVCSKHVGDRTAIITSINDDGSVFRFTGCAGFGFHESSYRVCGIKGQVENIRGGGGKVALNYNEWNKPEYLESNSNIYEPEKNDPDQELIDAAGHNGGDFVVMREFLTYLREGKRPIMDVYFSVTLSAVAILSHRSLMENGRPYDIPDFRDPEVRELWRNDRTTPFYGPNGELPNIACSSKPWKPSEEQLNAYFEGIKNR